MSFHVPFRELLAPGLLGVVFGILGYFLARHVNHWVGLL